MSLFHSSHREEIVSGSRGLFWPQCCCTSSAVDHSPQFLRQKLASSYCCCQMRTSPLPGWFYFSFPSPRWMWLKRLSELHLPRFGIKVFLLLRYSRSTVPYSVIFGTISRGRPARDFLHLPPGGHSLTLLYPSETGTKGSPKKCGLMHLGWSRLHRNLPLPWLHYHVKIGSSKSNISKIWPIPSLVSFGGECSDSNQAISVSHFTFYVFFRLVSLLASYT